MADSTRVNGPPETVLLATDLGARCDRALDRALQLAGQWKARLLAAHAIETEVYPDPPRVWNAPAWRRPPDPERRAYERLLADLDGAGGVEVAIRVRTGRPADVVLEAAEEEGAGLIVTGIARDGALAPSMLGDTVSQLVRRSPVPVLITRERVRGPYRSVVVATDFSASSRRALETACRFFPDAGFTLLNGYDIPFSIYLDRKNLNQGFRDMGQEAARDFLAEADIPAEVRDRAVAVVEQGAPEALLRDYVHGHGTDLTVVGSHGGGAVYELMIGSTAGRIIDTVPGDILLVREPAAD